jgi:hypothetical protein
MHHIHLTKAFVLSSFPFSEAGKILNLLTKDFGVIRVNAQATRKSNSKLRQSIQDYSLTEVALVFGKKGWILTNANIEENFFYKIKNQSDETTDETPGDNSGDTPDEKIAKNKIETIARIFSLVERMIPFEHDEEQGSYIFDLISKNLPKIVEAKNKEIRNIEISVVYQIMVFLGYVGENPYDSEKIQSDLAYVEENKKSLVEIINNAIKESHL